MGWTNSRDFHNHLIPYECKDVSSMYAPNQPYDDYIDYYLADTVPKMLYSYEVNKFEIESEMLAHMRVRSLYPNRPYRLKMTMLCTSDHRQYRACWLIEWKDKK